MLQSSTLHPSYYRQDLIKSYEYFKNDKNRLNFISKINYYISIAPIKRIIINENQHLTELDEDYQNIIDKLKQDLERYELSTYPILFNKNA